MVAIINLLLVIVPRVRMDTFQDKSPEINVTFFGGISQFSNPSEFADYLEKVSNDNAKTYNMFANQVFALGKINAYKNRALKRAIVFFATAIISELLIIMSMAWAKAYPYLFPTQ